MQTQLAESIRSTADGAEADAILRRCVHCGFCNATCPTYQVLGNELDGPRGRIYLIKQMLEGGKVTRSTQLHLDRCLTCRACETTCPSGVEYGKLAAIGRREVARQVRRTPMQHVLRHLLAHVLPNAPLFNMLFRIAQRMRGVLPHIVRDKIPPRERVREWSGGSAHSRKMLLLGGCVQPAMLPNVNQATMRVLDAIGIQAVVASNAGCCGALREHLDYHEAALDDARRNIDAWWPDIEAGAEAIVSNASGCGAMLRDYGHLLRDDPDYAEKAARVSAMAKDIGEVLACLENELAACTHRGEIAHVAYHPPCTLQHGMRVQGQVEHVLASLGLEVSVPVDKHLCCGSAGTYSLLQPALSYEMRKRKLEKLHALEPQVIVSGNVGCIAHLQSGTRVPVKHWIEVVEGMLFR